MRNTKKLALAGILVAMGVLLSFVSAIPIGATAKIAPFQHLINVVAGIFLGPLYAVTMAFVTSILRLIFNTGSLLAFPGSMVGALLCGLLYKYTKNIFMAFIGEVIGTGVIGAILAFPIVTLVLSREAALFGFVIPFSLSSFVGASIAFIFIVALKKRGILNKLNFEVKNTK